MKKRKTLKLLVTITIPARMQPGEARKHVREKINRVRYSVGMPIGDLGIRAAKVTPATLAQFKKMTGDR